MIVITFNINRMALGQSVLISLIIHILLLILQVDSGIVHDRNKREEKCPRLYFYSESLGCQRCSLCQPGHVNTLFRPECKEKHPDPIPHQKEHYLWCDNPAGPFPECPHLHESIVLKKSDNCTNISLGQQFTPGCVCTVGCSWEASFSIRCGQDLQWSDPTNIPSACNVPTPRAQPAMSQAPREHGDTTVISNATSSTKEKESIVWLPAVISAVVVILALAIGIAVFCIYKRCHEKDSSPSNSSSFLETSSQTSDAGTQAPLIPAKNGVPKEAASTPCKHGPDPAGTILGGVDVAPDPTEAVQTHLLVDECQKTESDALLGRGAAAINPQLYLELTTAPSKLAAKVTVHEVEKQDNTEEQTNSRRALGDLMNSRKDLLELTKMFDQEHAFGKLTWHDVAVHFIGWDSDMVRSKEYLSRPCTANGIPGDGPMYAVLKEAQENGKGLLDLIHCLRSFDHRNKEAENFLETYWQKWRLEHDEHHIVC